tara:strand:- start:45 stop:245 length:201 start_codon:yes stop_codon:yes gene_type:complete
MIMKLHTNDVYVLKEILKKVALRDYDLIEDREVNALRELLDTEYDARMARLRERELNAEYNCMVNV